MSAAAQMSLGGYQHVLDYIRHMKSEDPNFYCAIQGDQEHGKANNIFWATPSCRRNYSYFGDTVTFHTSYRGRGYQVPFVTFTGINHHRQPVLFGCGLLLDDESVPSYVWLLQNWLDSVSGRQPVSITTTEPNRYIQIACSQVFPQTHYRYSKWSIFREAKENLSCVLYQSYPSFETEFIKCVNESETVEDFESQWEMLLAQYGLMENDWLQTMYNARRHWVPVYLRATFFGGVDENDDGRCLYFDGFIDSNTTMFVLIEQYEKAVASWQGKELRANEDAANTIPELKTPSPMEKQAADLYTMIVFTMFQDELVETMAIPVTLIGESGSGSSTFRVAKFGEDHKGHIVNFDNAGGIKATCSCQMFEFCGIVCRHILSVFRAKNVLTLPAKYVLKRWTRNAKDEAQVVGGQRSPLAVLRHSGEIKSILSQEAIKFAEEGAKSIHSFHVAMEALRGVSGKVAVAKSAMSIEGSSALSGNNDKNYGGDGENQELTGIFMEEKAKRIRELSKELEHANKRCETYKSSLLAVLNCIEDEKLKLSVNVQNARLSLKKD